MKPDRCLERALTTAGIRDWAVLADPGQLVAAGLDRCLADGIGDMTWLARERSLRLEPRRLLPGLQALVLVLWPYDPKAEQSMLRRARYAAGRDYHRPLRRLLAAVGRQLAAQDDEKGQAYISRACVDSAPLNERQLAVLAELGWLGRNALLLHPRRGSYHFLGCLLTTAPLSPRSGAAGADRCGTCRRCETLCPTGALRERRCLSERCISYLTIEHQGVIARAFATAFGGWWYGCDLCQEVCPWNRFAGTDPVDGRLRGQDEEKRLLQIAAGDFDRYFAGRAIRRLGFERFQRNLLIALWNGDRRDAIVSLPGYRLPLVQAQLGELMGS